MLQRKTGVRSIQDPHRLLWIPYCSTALLKTIHSIFNSLLYEGTQLITYTQETVLVFQPRIIACSLSPRQEASRLEGERERGRLFRDKSNNRGNGLWLIDEGASSCREGAIRCQEGTRCLASKFPRIPLQGEECSIWRFDWRESVNRLSWIKHSRIRRSGGELIRIHSSGVREDYKESFGKFEGWKGTVIDWKNIWKSTSRFRSNFVLSYRENLFLIVALVFFFFFGKRETLFWKEKRINRRESWCWCEESCSVIVVWLRDSPAFRWIVLKTRKQGGKKPANWMLQTVPRLPRPRLTLLSPRMTGEESLI